MKLVFGIIGIFFLFLNASLATEKSHHFYFLPSQKVKVVEIHGWPMKSYLDKKNGKVGATIAKDLRVLLHLSDESILALSTRFESDMFYEKGTSLDDLAPRIEKEKEPIRKKVAEKVSKMNDLLKSKDVYVYPKCPMHISPEVRIGEACFNSFF